MHHIFETYKVMSHIDGTVTEPNKSNNKTGLVTWNNAEVSAKTAIFISCNAEVSKKFLRITLAFTMMETLKKNFSTVSALNITKTQIRFYSYE